MILRNATFAQFAADVAAKDKKIILFGTGSLLSSWISYVVQTYSLSDQIAFCVDNNKAKWNTAVTVGDGRFPIYSAEVLKKNCPENAVILITSSYFASMIEQLDQMPELDSIPCYIAVVMHITNQKQCNLASKEALLKEKGIAEAFQKPKIPKVIHYCWFGRKPMPEKNQQCIDSWKKFCPDYELVRWDESNYDIHKNLYMQQAYDAGKYGFVPDYARLDLLCEYGGLYFDTDVEIIRNIDALLEHEAFCSFEEYPTINMGGGSGAVKGFPLFMKMRDFREKEKFLIPDGEYNLTSCGYYESIPLVKEGLRLDGTLQQLQGLTVYPSDYFHPKSSVTGKIERTENTYSVHHFNWSWVGEKQMQEKLETQTTYQAVLQRMEKERYHEEG